MTLRYAQWLPGNHAPTGPIPALAGLRITGSGRPIAWRRNPRDVYAFDVDVPSGVRQLDIAFEFLSPTASDQGRVVMTPEMLNLQWEKTALYPAGHYVRQIMIRPSVTLPAGWTGIAALDGETRQGNRLTYAVTSYETLVDSPMFAARHYRKWDLGNNVDLNVFADRPEDLAATPEQIRVHRAMVDQTLKTFGSVDEGVRVLVLCGRDDPEAANGPSFDQVYAQLEEERVNRRARRYLRDLRRDAVVDYR